jgi:hypothetical protein
LSIGAREIAVEISRLTQHITDDRGTWPRLSDDMPAIKLANELDAELNTLVPDGQTIVVALNAPMLNVHKTSDALRKMLRERLPNVQSFLTEEKVTINSNVITISRHHRKPNHKKIVGVVASSSYSIRDILSKTDIFYNARYILEERITDKTKKCSEIVGKNLLWLALLNDYALADAHTYKDTLSQLSLSNPFEKILLVSRDGTVEPL